MPLYFDSHAHYDNGRFDDDRDVLLAGLADAGVGAVLNAASDVQSSRAALALAQKYSFIWASAGVHPHDADTLNDETLLEIERLCRQDRVAALGEIGLDYHYDHSPREAQRAAFARQLGLARELNLPVIVHSRDAARDTFELVKEFRPRGVIHCFSGSAELAREYADLGLYIGFTGVVTFPNARKPLEAARAVPLSRLLIETDCPYMAPVPLRGRRCDSTMLPHTASVLAEAVGVSVDQLARTTWDNAMRVYEIQ